MTNEPALGPPAGGPSTPSDPEPGLTVAELETRLRELAGPAMPETPAAPRGRQPPHVPAPLAASAPSAHPPPGPAGRGGTVLDRRPPAPAAVAAAAKLRDVLEAMPDALVIVDGGGRIVLVNSHAEQLFGYGRDELPGWPVELLVPERDRDGHIAARAAYAARPHVRPMGAGLALFARRKDGQLVPVEISLSPMRADGGGGDRDRGDGDRGDGHDGDGLLVITSVRDIRDRKRAETQLRTMEARYRTLVEGIPAVTFMAALDGGANELYVSPQIEALLGFSQREWVENPVLWYTQLHPDDRVRWHTEFARTCVTGQPFRSVYRFVARDGRVVWVHGEAQVVRDDAGRPLFLQGVAFDITGMKEAEEQLRALNQTLEQRVAARTAEAEHRAVELARSNEALEQFGYVVAHDLRQPLRTIKSFTQKLAERHQGRLDAQADDYLTRTINAADRMRVLIDDLLAYSRVGTQGQPPGPVGCGPAVAAACANLQAAIDESGAEVAVDPLPTVMADDTQLVQLFQNLIGNALKFRADRPPRIRVGAARADDRWVVSVADNGIGIEPQYLERIFGLGERLHSVAKFPGNGIGLATCEKIVQRHGGRIWAESPGLDLGATISVALPACPEAACPEMA